MSMIIGKSVDVEAYDKDGNKLENVCRIEKPEIFKKRSKEIGRASCRERV